MTREEFVKDGNQIYRCRKTEEKIEVMKAYTEGKQIQVLSNITKTWEDINREPFWDWINSDYRVKPETTYRSDNYWMTLGQYADGYSYHHCAEIPKEETNQVQNVDEMIKILNAYKEGKQIQFYDLTVSNKIWKDVIHEPLWDWSNCLYRIKPEPRRMTYKELDNWLEQGKGVIRIGNHRMSNRISYDCEDRNKEVNDAYKICGWDEDTWHEPLIEE